jgi:lipoprotein-anchoring transpeptidase ErfK/SrfK
MMVMRVRRISGGLAALVAVAGLLTGGAAAAHRSGSPPAWQAPTPAAGAVLTARVDASFELGLAAASPDPAELIMIDGGELPIGASLASVDGNPATTLFSWTPSASQAGDHTLTFTATPGGDPTLTARTSVTVRVTSPAVRLSGPGDVSHWAQVVRPTVARVAPARTAPVVARVGTETGEFLPMVLSLLTQRTDSSGESWVRVRLAILPNGSTGWVPQSALGPYHKIDTRLLVERSRLRLTLFRQGRPVFRARIGIGKPQWPTPAGQFYVREKLANFGDPFYGPILFGTSARSSVLTDWPGGGYIGIHGTSLPQLLPGRVSHGCIRLNNRDIVRLARLMPIGTLLTVR